jgi:hypothetical protein
VGAFIPPAVKLAISSRTGKGTALRQKYSSPASHSPEFSCSSRNHPGKTGRTANNCSPASVAEHGSKCWHEVPRERVVLTGPVPAEALEAGNVGTVVHVYRDGLAYEVEFTTLAGKTAAVVTLGASQVRPVADREITHAQELTPA